MINICIINGGRGAKPLISKLIKYKNINITSIINGYDDGKSTNEIRSFFNMLGPSDIRKVQEIMLDKKNIFYSLHKKLFNFRFPKNANNKDAKNEILKLINLNKNTIVKNIKIDKILFKTIANYLNYFLKYLNKFEISKNKEFNFNDCALMNCIYAGAYMYHNQDFSLTIKKMSKLFDLSHNVIANSNKNRYLIAIRNSGIILKSEADIVELRSNVRINKLYLTNKKLSSFLLSKLDNLNIKEKIEYFEKSKAFVNADKNLLEIIKKSNIIIYAPGTQHSSLYPTYFTKGFSKMIAENKTALKFFITNIGADYETPNYSSSEYIKGAINYLNLNSKKKYSYIDFFDYNLINDPSLNINKNSNYYVKYDKKNHNYKNVTDIVDFFEDNNLNGSHNGSKIVKIILSLYSGKYK